LTNIRIPAKNKNKTKNLSSISSAIISNKKFLDRKTPNKDAIPKKTIDLNL
tara:strand:+ start:961 stop:1113 length:153 start_codon:yes stop_codon:yes gene_type:complete